MFHSLGRNLTDTVVTRREAYLVLNGPYRFVRNPMYTWSTWSALAVSFRNSEAGEGPYTT
jgi:protein-S-isoprenylcysteine O-methyltransferase Ste14